jgi:hypothetical protein
MLRFAEASYDCAGHSERRVGPLFIGRSWDERGTTETCNVQVSIPWFVGKWTLFVSLKKRWWTVVLGWTKG